LNAVSGKHESAAVVLLLLKTRMEREGEADQSRFRRRQGDVKSRAEGRIECTSTRPRRRAGSKSMARDEVSIHEELISIAVYRRATHMAPPQRGQCHRVLFS
jgi:hypothetical protein